MPNEYWQHELLGFAKLIPTYAGSAALRYYVTLKPIRFAIKFR